ncbi:MAG: Crp/Fnr family transcriptional regulator [Burkholderiaceae bacterium]
MKSGSKNECLETSNMSSLRPSVNGLDLLRRLSSSEVTKRSQTLRFEQLEAASGTRLIEAGQGFKGLLLVKSGHLKTVFTDEGGNEQVVGFPVAGDLLGTDGISEGRHINDVYVLADAQVISIPFTDLKSLSAVDPTIVETVFQIISYQLVQEQLALTAIGALCADARVARFLLSIWYQRLNQGVMGQSLHLWMTRQDIGNYLGMKIETVSRTLTQLSSMGLISVDQRHVEILDTEGLKSIAYHGSLRRGPLLVRQRKSRSSNASHKQSISSTRPNQQASAQAAPVRLSPSNPWSALLDLK